MDVIWSAHSYLRVVLLVLGAVCFGLSVWPAIQRRPLPRAGFMAYRVLVWVLTLQALLGVIQLAAMWGQYQGALRHRLEHAAIMLAVVGITHWGMKFAKRTDVLGARNTAFISAGVFIMLILGILLLPQGARLLGFGD